MLDESEFLSPYGIRAMSKYHVENPFKVELRTTTLSAHYTPGEGDSSMFGGNSNWRGPDLDADELSDPGIPAAVSINTMEMISRWNIRHIQGTT